MRAKQYFIIDAACAAIAYALHQVQDKQRVAIAIFDLFNYLGAEFLLHLDPAAMATHILLQHLGPKCCCQGKVHTMIPSHVAFTDCHPPPSESDLMVQSGLGQRSLEPA